MNSKRFEPVLLSICIPTYNRCERVVGLVWRLLSVEGRFEICVHVDGSTDDSLVSLTSIQDDRLKVTVAPNKGRAQALAACLANCTGKFAMIFDDDDEIDLLGFAKALHRCGETIEPSVAGFIYNMVDSSGAVVGDFFSGERSNLIRLRADDRIRGDKKEIVLVSLLRRAASLPLAKYRRVPTSLYWARISMTHDIICINESLGVKNYLVGGMTATITRTKFANCYPLYLLHVTYCKAFLKGRFHSVRFLLRSVLGVFVYGALSITDGRKD